MEDDDMLDDEVRLMKKKNMKENRITSSSSQGIEKPGDPKMSKRKLKKMNRYNHQSGQSPWFNEQLKYLKVERGGA